MNPEFAVHILNEGGIQKAKDVAEAFDGLMEQLKFQVPAGRELAIVKTKLEEACFFAKKGIANGKENQK